MAIFEFLFGGSKPKTLNELSLDELNLEKLRLENEIEKLNASLRRLDQNDAQLAEEYRAARQTNRENLARQIGQKLLNLQTEMKGIRISVDQANKSLQTVIGLIVIKQMQERAKKIGLSSNISRMSMEDIQDFIDKATLDGKMNEDKLNTLLQGVDGGLASLTSSIHIGGADNLLAELDKKYGVESTSVSDAAIEEGLNKARNAQHS